MDRDKLTEWTSVYERFRAAVEALPSLIDDPEGHIEAWREIHRYEAELERIFPTSTEPLPRHPTE